MEVSASASCLDSSEWFEGPVCKTARMLLGADLKRKWSGGATYKTKLNRTWIKDFPFVASVRDNPYK